jgi:hypothetical protein
MRSIVRDGHCETELQRSQAGDFWVTLHCLFVNAGGRTRSNFTFSVPEEALPALRQRNASLEDAAATSAQSHEFFQDFWVRLSTGAQDRLREGWTMALNAPSLEDDEVEWDH